MGNWEFLSTAFAKLNFYIQMVWLFFSSFSLFMDRSMSGPTDTLSLCLSPNFFHSSGVLLGREESHTHGEHICFSGARQRHGLQRVTDTSVDDLGIKAFFSEEFFTSKLSFSLYNILGLAEGLMGGLIA
jgi:hypothetical protein